MVILMYDNEKVELECSRPRRHLNVKKDLELIGFTARMKGLSHQII